MSVTKEVDIWDPSTPISNDLARFFVPIPPPSIMYEDQIKPNAWTVFGEEGVSHVYLKHRHQDNIKEWTGRYVEAIKPKIQPINPKFTNYKPLDLSLVSSTDSEEMTLGYPIFDGGECEETYEEQEWWTI